MRARDKQVGGNHYKSMAIQPSEFIERNGLSWHEGNAIKYICRHRLKGGEFDIDKAIHYLELLKELEYNGCERSNPCSEQGAKEPQMSFEHESFRSECDCEGGRDANPFREGLGVRCETPSKQGGGEQ